MMRKEQKITSFTNSLSYPLTPLSGRGKVESEEEGIKNKFELGDKKGLGSWKGVFSFVFSSFSQSCLGFY